MKKNEKIDTRIIHTGSDPNKQNGAVNTPVYRASTVIFPTTGELKQALKYKYEKTFYGVHGTPSSFALEEAMAEIEGGYRAISVSSGLAAITTALITFLNSGDHLLMVDSVYGPTRNFCDTVLKSFGIETTYYDPMAGNGIKHLVKLGQVLDHSFRYHSCPMVFVQGQIAQSASNVMLRSGVDKVG